MKNNDIKNILIIWAVALVIGIIAVAFMNTVVGASRPIVIRTEGSQSIEQARNDATNIQPASGSSVLTQPVNSLRVVQQ